MARFRDIELEELPLEDIQGLGGELSPEMAALVERVGRSAEDVASRVLRHNGPVRPVHVTGWEGDSCVASRRIGGWP